MELDKQTEFYIAEHSDKEDPVLSELTRETHLKVPAARMLSGFIQGKFFEFISKMVQAEKILEIGTFTGYSAICWAKGLKENGKLYTIEINDEREAIIKKYIKKSGMENKIELLFGDALEIIPNLNHQFDIIFIDADKPSYLNYYKLSIDKLKSGGFIIADNVLWGGKVLFDNENDESTTGIKEFNTHVNNDKRVEKFILPLRDGLMLIRKK